MRNMICHCIDGPMMNATGGKVAGIIISYFEIPLD